MLHGTARCGRGVAAEQPDGAVGNNHNQTVAVVFYLVQPVVAARRFRCGRCELQRCAIEDRKALLRDVVGIGGCERIVVVDYMTSNGTALFEAVRQIGAEGIVSKRAGATYRGGSRHDWLKTKVSETGRFVITGFAELGPGLLDAVYVAELRGDRLMPAGGVRFGLAGKALWRCLDQLRAGPSQLQSRGPGIVPVRTGLVVEIKYLGRVGGDYLRDGVLLRVHEVKLAG